MDFECLPVGTVALLGRLGYILEHGRWVPADGGCVEWVEPDDLDPRVFMARENF